MKMEAEGNSVEDLSSYLALFWVFPGENDSQEFLLALLSKSGQLL